MSLGISISVVNQMMRNSLSSLPTPILRLNAADLPNSGVFNGTSDVYSTSLSFDVVDTTYLMVATVTGTTAGTCAALSVYGAGATNYLELQAAATGTFRGRLRASNLGQSSTFIDPANPANTQPNVYNTKTLFVVRVRSDGFATIVGSDYAKTMTKSGGTNAVTTVTIGRGRATGYTAMTCHELQVLDVADDTSVQLVANDMASRHGVDAPVLTPYLDTTVVAFGDSIVAGVGSSAGLNSFVEVGAKSIIAKEEHVTPLTATAGARVCPVGEVDADKITAAFSNAAPLLSNYTSRSMAIVSYGTNDYGSDIPLGTSSDSDATTFWGAAKIGFAGLVSAGLPTVVCLPFPRSGENVANGAGSTLQDYRDVISTLATSHGCTIADLSTAWGYATESDTYTGDGLHPNDAGHALGGAIIAAAIAGGVSVPT